MRAGQGICVLRQGILGYFRPSLDIFGAKGLFYDTFLFEGGGCIPPPPLDSCLLQSAANIVTNWVSFSLLQSEAKFVAFCGSFLCYKVRQKLLQSGAIVTKWGITKIVV